MKKAISMILLVFVCLSIAVPAWAEGNSVENNTPLQSPCFTVTYTDIPDGFTVPTETLTFVSTEAADNPESKPISFGEQTQDEDVVTVPIMLPQGGYSKVGIYTYTITQNAGSTLGVSYDTDPIVFRVLVGYVNEENEDNQIGIIATGVGKALVINGEISENVSKKAGFINIYNDNGYGILEVTNTVRGNIGDRQKLFSVTVTFTAPENKIVWNEITYTDPETNTEKKISAGDWKVPQGGSAKTAVVTIKLKNGQKATFSNVPAGVGYEVSQTAETGYEIEYDHKNGTITADSTANAEITNTMTGNLNTGIMIRRAPYIIVLVGGIGGLVLLLRGKRKRGF